MLLEKINSEELTLNIRELEKRMSTVGHVDYINDPRYLQLLESANCLYAAEMMPIERRDGRIFIGDAEICGSAFDKVAKDSSRCFIMVCTLGQGVDRLIAKEQQLSVSDAFVIDAMADALIESLCDAAEVRFSVGMITAPRFSPGYGDLPLKVGRDIVSMLGADRLLGIKFTESGLMVPRKSVSAIVCVKD